MLSAITGGGPRGTRRKAATSAPNDINGTGTTAVESDLGYIEWPEDVIFARMPLVRISVVAERTGGTGFVEVGARFGQFDGTIGSSQFTVASDGHLPYTRAVGSVGRDFYFRPSESFQPPRDSNSPARLFFYVYGRGSESDTEWSVSSISAELIYEPL